MNSTDCAYEELEAILTRECDAHEQLLTAATKVNSAIKESDLATLQNHTSHLDAKVAQIEQIELQRTDCCKALSRSLGIDRTPVRLTALIEKAPPRFRDTLSRLHRSLRSVLEKISNINVSNRVLLEEGLELVRGRFSLIATHQERFTQYRQGGRISGSKTMLHPFINQTI
ncbi:MAG: flagellar export chaperone FlgN [Chitinispirillaceae bacterium]|nr:flagellar export chaperone FlgN [Chitinispirillaceae bacterium]